MIYRRHWYDIYKKPPVSHFAPPPRPVLLAVQPLDLKVWVEVEDDALRGLRRRDDPVTVLVRRVLQRITWGGDVTRLAGVEDAAALRCCDSDSEGETEGWGYSRGATVIDWKSDKMQEQSSKFGMFFILNVVLIHCQAGVKPYKSPVNGAFPRTVTQRNTSSFTLFLCI